MADEYEMDGPPDNEGEETHDDRGERERDDADEQMDDASAKKWRMRIEAAKRKTKEYLTIWQDNVDYRRGKPFDTASDQDRIAVNLDWPNTKAKQAQLFSQVPQVMFSSKLKDVPGIGAAVPIFGRELNEEIKKAGIEAAMNECLPDVINAAGIAAAITWYETKTERIQVPQLARSQAPGLSDEEWQLALDSGLIPMDEGVREMDARLRIERLSPANLLWAKGFKGSDFNQCPWVGRRGKLTWADAKSRFDLDEDDREAVLGSSENKWDDTVSDNSSDREDGDDVLVEFEEIFYKRYLYHVDEMNFDAIQHVVFVGGKSKPVVDSPWSGQQWNEQTGRYVGSCLYPIQFCTLAYMSDEAVPPSDSEIGRPQVDELNESRTQMMLQRRHSQPLRWVDQNRVDMLVMDAIQRGTYQGFIPVNGDGDRAVGEVARAQYPSENFAFDRVAKDDIRESWQIGANQNGTMSTGETSASEANIVQANFQTRIGFERSLVTKFFLNVVTVAGGLLALYGKFEMPEVSPEDMQRLEGWDRSLISTDCVYSIRPDATVLLDAPQKIKRLNDFLNMTAASGYVEVEPILREMAELSGLDPDTVVRKPQPKGLDPANLSFRFGGAEDLQNPMVVGVMLKNGLAPSPDELAAAKALIMSASGFVSGEPTGEAAPISEAEKPPIPGEGNDGWNTLPRINTRRAVGEGE